MLFIYTDTISNRLIYTLDFIFANRGIKYSICDDFIAFDRFDGQRFNYSDRHFENVKKIIPSPLLFGCLSLFVGGRVYGRPR